jgi:hypothetical protein
MAITKFTILYVKTKDPDTLDNMSKLAVNTLKSVHTIREIQYNEFLTYTRSKPIPRYILLAKEEARQKIEEAKMQLSNNHKFEINQDLSKFHAIKTNEADVVDLNNKADPAYAILDTHQVSPTEFIIILNRNPGIPIFNFLLLRKLASRISKMYMTAVMSVDDFKNMFVEHLSYFSSGTITRDITVPLGHSLLTEFKNKTSIDINDLLIKIDKNIDILMAPNDLSDYNGIMAKLLESKAFLERTGAKDPNSDVTIQDDYKDLLEEVRVTEENIQEVTTRIKIDPAIDSRYFKFENPKELETYLKRPLTSTEVASLY